MWKSKALTASNALSLFRVILLLPIYHFLSQNTGKDNLIALSLMGLAIISDYLDGFLARRLGQITDWGKVLDPLADKICIVVICIILASPVRENPIPLWFIGLILVRDLAILSGGYLIYHRQSIIVKSNIWGKSTSTVLALMLISYVIKLQPPPEWISWLNYQFLLWLSVSFIFVSSMSYGWLFIRLMVGKKGVVQSGLYNPDSAQRSASQSKKGIEP